MMDSKFTDSLPDRRDIASQAIGQSVQPRSDKCARSRVTQLAPPFPEDAGLPEFKHRRSVVDKLHVRNVHDLLQATPCSASRAGQSGLLRAGLILDFRRAGLDPAKLVVNGNAMDFGGAGG
jgi:hypothetical protein